MFLNEENNFATEWLFVLTSAFVLISLNLAKNEPIKVKIMIMRSPQGEGQFEGLSLPDRSRVIVQYSQ
jgi:hypothetical protein